MKDSIIAIINFIKDFFDKDKINLIEFCLVIFISISILEFINIFKDLKDSNIYILIKAIQICSLIYLIIKLLEIIYLKLKDKFMVKKDLKDNQEILSSLGNDELNVLYLFYNIDTNKFNSTSLIYPNTIGLSNLEKLNIINFNGYLDEEGGYSSRVKQPYLLKEKYRLSLNNIMSQKKNNQLKEYILNHKGK
ncbi:MAG: superinfection exclusion B family protein [Erysipelotrichaceae bacterium]|nr:superinfection exclusion B family protein [Erysipelotrichaceae bacterium]